MASLVYDSFEQDSKIGNIDLESDTFYMMLVTATYTASKAHAKRSDITNEVSGAGYTAGGAAVALTWSLDTGNHRFDITPGDVTWAAATLTARAGVIYKSRGGASSADELVAYCDFGGNIVSTGGTFATHATGPLRYQN